MRDLIVNGIPMRDPLGAWSIDYTRSSLFGTVSRVFDSENLVGYHGVDTSSPAFFGSAQDTLVLNLQAGTKDQFNTLLRSLMALFLTKSYTMISAPQRTPLNTAPAPLSPRTNRTFNALPALLQVASGRTIGSIAVERINEKVARLTVIVERPHPFWLGVEEQDTTEQFEIYSAPVRTLNLDSLANSTAPITTGYIRLEGQLPGGSSVTIADRGLSSNALKLNIPTLLPGGNQYLIELPSLRVKRHSALTWDINLGTDARNTLELTSTGGFSLTPEVAAAFSTDIPAKYQVQVTRTGASSTAGISFRLRRSYLS